MTEKQRTWTAGIIGFIAVVIVVFLAPSPIYKARGILLPTQKMRPSIAPNAVLQLQNRPFGGVVLGHINIERHYPSTNKQGQKEIAELAQKLSAKVGANAFVVTLFRIGQVTRSNYIYVFQATAYYAPSVQSAMEFPLS